MLYRSGDLETTKLFSNFHIKKLVLLLLYILTLFLVYLSDAGQDSKTSKVSLSIVRKDKMSKHLILNFL